MNYSKLITI